MDDAEALAHGRALLSLIRSAYQSARDEHTSAPGDAAFPTQIEWVKQERAGRLSGLRFAGGRFEL